MKIIIVGGNGTIGKKVSSFLSKENEIITAGRNSGVLHCGLAYQPGSLRAKLSVEGIKQMTSYCIKHNINHDICGKIVVATSKEEIKNLDLVALRGKKNGLKGLKFLSNKEVKSREGVDI